jgi:hypothetical protein
VSSEDYEPHDPDRDCPCEQCEAYWLDWELDQVADQAIDDSFMGEHDRYGQA